MKIDYEKEVNDYGRSLEPVAKQVARDVFTDLLQMGYDYEWIYFAIMNLGQRDIARHRGLFSTKHFKKRLPRWLPLIVKQRNSGGVKASGFVLLLNSRYSRRGSRMLSMSE